MNGKDETPKSSQTEDQTFNALKRKSFHELMRNMKICWIDNGVIDILQNHQDWEQFGDYVRDSGWTREEFVEECVKKKDNSEYTYDQYIIRMSM